MPAMLKLLAAAPTLAALQQDCFAGNAVVGSEVGDGAGLAYSDFLIHADGFGRLVLVNQGFTPLMAGRMLQRLFEIEAYRMMALLAFPVARRLAPRILAIERALAGLTDDIARDGGRDDEALLQELTRLAAEVESGLSASQFRFGACRAYAELVTHAHCRAARRRAQRPADHRRIHVAPLHAGGRDLRHRVAAHARPVGAGGQASASAVDPGRHRARAAEPGAAGLDGPARQAAAAPAADGRGPVGRGDRLLRGRPGRLRRQGAEGRRLRIDLDLAVGLAIPSSRSWRC